MFAGGSESCICKTGVAGFQALTALSESTDPLRASIPFDEDSGWTCVGRRCRCGCTGRTGACQENSGARIMRNWWDMQVRECLHITSPCEDGSGAAKAMELAINEAEILPNR